jgi:hypothetical protein
MEAIFHNPFEVEGRWFKGAYIPTRTNLMASFHLSRSFILSLSKEWIRLFVHHGSWEADEGREFKVKSRPPSFLSLMKR